MGINKSKLNFLTYDDAVKRVSEPELKRLKDAFKRQSISNSTLPPEKFISEVLGGFVPKEFASEMYKVLKGSSTGLTFKELLVGLVLLTRGRVDEKCKFLFSLYCHESGLYINKSDMDDYLLKVEGSLPHELNHLFWNKDRATYEQFQVWILAHPSVTAFSTWLLKEQDTLQLTDDTQMPTFYQTLAGVTHLDESSINTLEKRYWLLRSPITNKLDYATFRALVSPPVPDEVTQGLFGAFDENCDDHIDMKEMACGISACCHGPDTERHKFCFKIFDKDKDGKLNHEDLVSMLQIFARVKEESSLAEVNSSSELDYGKLANQILEIHDADHDGKINKEEYLMWTLGNSLAEKFLRLLYQICHVIFGLKPQFREEEKEVILAWREREEKKGLQPGTRVYLISSAWWRLWLAYVSYKPQLNSASINGELSSPGDWLNNNTTPPNSQASSINGLSATVGTNRTRHQKSASLTCSPVGSTGSLSSCGLSPTSPTGGTTSQTKAKPSVLTTKRSLHALDTHTNTYSAGTGTVNGGGTLGRNSRFYTPSTSPQVSLNRKPVIPDILKPPGQIDNSTLLVPSQGKIQLATLTDEGGLLRPNNMIQGRDFELLPEPLWSCMLSWYGGGPPLPRQVIPKRKAPLEGEPELYPLVVRVMRHVRARPTRTGLAATGPVGATASNQATNPGLGRVFQAGANMIMTIQSGPGQSANAAASLVPRRQVTNRACFSKMHTVGQIYDFFSKQLKIPRDEMRLWTFKDESNMTFLEDETAYLDSVGLTDVQCLLVEQRNPDLTWPEEIGQLAKNRALLSKRGSVVSGVTGLSNLGNTCFFNSAIQCVSNARPLTKYFTSTRHLYELNRDNPNGTKGHMALRYGELVKDLWGGSTSLIAPLKIKMTVERQANQFSGFMQHDAQELLAVLLDGLHEDLNRVTGPVKYKELKDSDGRPDELVAREAWEAHTLHNQSIIVDLFHGQLKSQVRCQECSHVSARFDPFSVLSLPLPMESSLEVEIIVFQPDGSTPVKYCLLMSPEDTYGVLKKALANEVGIPHEQILLGLVDQSQIRKFTEESEKINRLTFLLCAYIFPSVVAFTSDSVKPVNGGMEETRSMGNSSLGDTGSERSLSSQPETGPSSRSGSLLSSGPVTLQTHIVVYHRKMMPNNNYFLANTKFIPEIFGLPVVIPLESDVTNTQVYRAVWKHVSRLVSVTTHADTSPSNHAQDCDVPKSEYAFHLKMISEAGSVCATCSWLRFCRGCPIPNDSSPFVGKGRCYVAVDWEATALHLGYQSANEKEFIFHRSFAEGKRRMREPMDLGKCLEAFTREEQLGDDQLYKCSKCQGPRKASKKLDLWKLPPILIIHLKRFQFVNNRWQKSHKIVHFPMTGLDLSDYLVQSGARSSESADCDPATRLDGASPGLEEDSRTPVDRLGGEADSGDQDVSDPTHPSDTKSPSRGEVVPRYKLFAVSCHEGQLQMGHYVSYARNPNGNWYLFNDSSCKEVPSTDVAFSPAYILFYEREDLDVNAFLPDVNGRVPDSGEIADEVDSDLKRLCSIQ